MTRLVHFWEPPALCSGVSLKRTVGRSRGALQASMSVQIHAVENVSAFPYGYIVWVLKDPDCRGQRSLTASAPEWAASICLKPQSSERQRRKYWVEGAHSRIPLRASRPLGLGLDFATISNTAAVLGAALLEAGRVRLPGSRGAARGAFRAGNKAVGAFLTSGSPATPTHHPACRPVSPFRRPIPGPG